MNISEKIKVSCHRQDFHKSTHLYAGMLLLFLLLTLPTTVHAQRLSFRTNALEWMAASPNIGAEFTLSKHFTTEISVSVCPYKVTPKLYLNHYRIQPELKYWLESPLVKHYIGLTAFYSSFDLGIEKKGFYGDAYAAGFTYGYNWLLSRRWDLEVSTGLGVIGYRMARYTPGESHSNPNERGWVPALIKLGVSFRYVIK